MDKQTEKAIANLENEIGRMDRKENKVLIGVPNTGGVAYDNIANVYKLALAIKNSGYNVVMLYGEKESDFTSVEDWMGEEYAALEHVCVNDVNNSMTVSRGDVLIVPDFLLTILEKVVKENVPCHKVVFIQDMDYIFDLIPLGMQLANYGVEDVLTISGDVAETVKSYFPAANVQTVRLSLNNVFYEDDKIKEPYIMLFTEDEEVINNIAKGFYLRYPIFRFVSFKDSSHMSEELFADALRETPIMLFDNRSDNTGENILKALRCGCTVLAKIPNHFYEWMTDGKGNIRDGVNWYSENSQAIDMIATAVSNIIEGADLTPDKKAVDEILKDYIDTDFEGGIGKFIDYCVNKRKATLKMFITDLKSQEK